MKKKILFIVLISMCVNNLIGQPEPNKFEMQEKYEAMIKDGLNKYDVKIFENENDLETVMRNDGAKVIFKHKKNAQIFSVFDKGNNGAYIASLFNALDEIDRLSNSLEVLNALSEPAFYESFEHCSCVKGPIRITSIYKDAWVLVDAYINKFSIPKSKIDLIQTQKIDGMLKKIKEHQLKINNSEINKPLSGKNTDELISYITTDVIPINSTEMKEIYKLFEEIKAEIKSFTYLVQLFD